MAKPIIGITLDSQESGGYSRYKWYALREHYADVIAQCGGIPLPLTHYEGLSEEFAGMIHGLLITGGGFDVPPHLYGEHVLHELTKLNERRTLFEFSMARQMMKYQKPCLGICGGMQLLNVLRGGTLIQDIPSFLPDSTIQHMQEDCRHKPSHEVTILGSTRLIEFADGKERVLVNSVHHQAVKEVGQGLVVSALADDGIIEAIEDPLHPYFVGVQWHPEFIVSALDRKLIKAFVDVSKVRLP